MASSLLFLLHPETCNGDSQAFDLHSQICLLEGDFALKFMRQQKHCLDFGVDAGICVCGISVASLAIWSVSAEYDGQLFFLVHNVS